ncbi:class I SAM-dependent methyltransferase [Rhodobacteraceae bacterium]|nr:class I SAM-dependent methyltransferase [Paracoccaceae bacterium]
MTDLTDAHIADPEKPLVQHHKYYGPALPALQWVPAPRYLMRRDRALHHARKIGACRAMDIGCGPAALISELANEGFEAFGVDRSADALRLARELNGSSASVTLQAELDPAWKETFDLIMSFEVIEHLEEDVAAMRDWRAYLKSGGRMILSTPAHPSRWNAADVWAGHVRRYTKDNLIAAISEAGFVVETIECYGFPLANVMEVWRARAYGKVLERPEKSEKSTENLTNESGSDRSVESRFWPLFSSTPIAIVMRLACQIQRLFLRTQLGNGFLIVARKS